jgi:2-polyprenyl-3-methyl-5-hydroxy-6-metoxy-1,4-benzoquinol methylase
VWLWNSRLYSDFKTRLGTKRLPTLTKRKITLKSLASIYPVMQKYGVRCTPDEFQHTLNLVFHKAESNVYDQVHSHMWASLPQQFHLLISDYLETGHRSGRGLTLLDVGCGTGLASELLLKTQIGERISEVDLLDTSPEMLQKAWERARGWRPKTTLVDSTIDKLAERNRKYDIILVCSVLHHIPDVMAFLRHVRKLQASSGIFLHLQDPNGDYLHDSVLKQRTAELLAYQRPVFPKWVRRLSPRRVMGRVRRRFAAQQDQGYLDRVNNELMESGVIQKAMAAQDIWRVTDIHVHDGKGVSVNELSELLVNYQMISTRSYSFFGKMVSELPAAFQQREQRLIERKAPNGLEVAGLWKVNN